MDPTHEPRPMKRALEQWATPRTALILGLVMTVFVVAAVPLSLLTHSFPTVAPFVPAAMVGVLLAHRRPRNPIGWIFIALGLGVAVTSDAALYAILAYRFGHPDLPLARLAVVAGAAWIALLLLLPLPVLLFPDGRLPSRRWRWTLWVYAALTAFILVVIAINNAGALTDRHVLVDSNGALVRPSHQSTSTVASVIWSGILLLYVGIALAWVLRQVLGYRGSTGDRRAQLKWLISGGAVSLVGLLTLTVSDSSSPIVRAAANIGFFGVVALPVSIAVGVLKYRLYEIDRLVSRTLSYAIVTGLLVGVYVGMIAFTTRLVPLSSSVGVAASTLVAVGLFTPIRRWVQHRVDRRFNRNRYDSEAMVATFSSRLRDAVQLETVRSDLLDVVNRAVEPSQLSLWIRPVGR
jgi:hypothetical protein